MISLNRETRGRGLWPERKKPERKKKKRRS
jgi:hypothetical protein